MQKKVIDVHVHFGAPHHVASGCYWSKDFEKTAAFLFMRLMTNSLFKKMSYSRISKKLFRAINKSKYVDQCVLLAMDEVYDEQGNKHKNQTHLHVPNKHIAGLAKENERILLGCSVHPYRKDWKTELDFCLANRAMLCKWIPSSQLINPEHDNCQPFYEYLAKHNLPLLIHAGPEYAIPTSKKSYEKYNNPKYIRKALDMGVTAIIAHCALPYFGFLDTKYLDDLKDTFKLFKEADEKRWKLYADLSAITTPLRAAYVPDVKEKIAHSRLLFGSDYPIPMSELSYTRSINIFSWLKFLAKAIQIKNPLDKNYYLIRKMGFDKEMFFNARELFAKIKY